MQTEQRSKKVYEGIFQQLYLLRLSNRSYKISLSRIEELKKNSQEELSRLIKSFLIVTPALLWIMLTYIASEYFIYVHVFWYYSSKIFSILPCLLSYLSNCAYHVYLKVNLYNKCCNLPLLSCHLFWYSPQNNLVVRNLMFIRISFGGIF